MSGPRADPAHVVRSIAIEIEAPAALVWEILTDLPNYNDWNPFCVRAVSTLALGAPVVMNIIDYANPGQLKRVVEYVCAFEPERLLAWEAPFAPEWPYPARRDQVLEALGPERCRYHSTDAFLGENGVHVMRFSGEWVTRAFDDTARALKRHAEQLHASRKQASTLAAPSHEHMRDVMLRYAERLSAGDVERIVALFAPDATLEDPVGSALQRGHEAIRTFYRKGFEQTANTMRMEPEGAVRTAGNEAACAMRVHCRVGEQPMMVETLDTMRFDTDGRIVALRAHVGPLNFHGQDR